MANQARGELEIILDDGTSRTLRLTMNNLCAAESRTGKKLIELFSEVDGFSPTALREMYLTALQPYHAAEFPTVEAAGDCIDRMGGMFVAFVKFRELGELNQPGAGAGNPQTPAGTGDGSMLRAVG
jgi:hypothetical protein